MFLEPTGEVFPKVIGIFHQLEFYRFKSRMARANFSRLGKTVLLC